jgi:glycosyltransferase involved in cell wall biosynthesis
MRVLMETTALTRPGQERGLGRYTNACLAGARALGCDVTELRVRNRSGRSAEFVDLAERSVRSLLDRHDIFHFTHPQVWGPSRTPAVASILDLIPIDLPGYRQTGLKTSFFLARAARASVILTISQFTAGRIVQHFDVDPERVVVAPLFPVATFSSGRDSGSPRGLPDRRYVLSVVDMATRDSRKRSSWIAPLARELKHAGIALVVAGAGTDRGSAALGDALGVGRASDSQLAQLARHSVCFLYFSAYEGQGLPPLEAMAAGAAVVSTANTAIAEVIADAGVLIDERSSSWSGALLEDMDAEVVRRELVEACVAIARDDSLRADLQARGSARASLFSEDRFCDGLASAYRLATCE